MKFQVPRVTPDSIAVFAILTLTARECFGGALIYYLDQFGCGFLWPIPDAVAGASILYSTSYNLFRGWKWQIFSSSLILVSLIPVFIGLFKGNPYVSIASGLKVYFPFLICVLAPGFMRVLMRCSILFLTFLLICCVSVILNRYFSYPWTGYTLYKFGTAVEASRLWWSSEGQRLAGTTTGSFAAGTMIVFTYCGYLVTSKSRVLPWVVWGLACYAMTLTNFKTGLIPLFLSPFGLLLFNYLRSRAIKFPLWDMRYVSSLLCLLSSLVPFSLAVGNTGSDFAKGQGGLDSFLDRVHNTWPQIFSKIIDNRSVSDYLIGVGYGEFGTASKYAGKYIGAASDVDNGFLYAYLSFGSIAFLMLLLIVYANVRSSGVTWLFLLCYAGVSVTTGYEGSATLMLAGIAVAGGLNGGSSGRLFTPR